MTGGPPARIDRAALERILQRAAELQAGEHELGEAVTPDEVLALGRDVGIPARYLQQAILEEQSRVETRAPSGALNWLAGPGSVTAQRVVQGDVERTQLALMAYMEEQELLCVQRRQPGRVSWEPLGGFQAAVRRSTAAFGSGKRPYMLAKARVVHAVFTELEAGYVHVSLSADLRPTRAAYVGGGAAMGSLGLAGATVLLALGAFPLIAVAPLALGTGLGYGVLRMYPAHPERAQLGLERALDHLEQGSARPRHELPPQTSRVAGAISDEIRKALKRLTVLALLVSCSPATSRPPFDPMPEARTGRVELEVPAATQRLAEALTAQGIPVSRVVQRDGYLETRWFDAATGTPSSSRALGDDQVRVRGWIRPAGRYASEATVEVVYRPYADPSASERDLERSVPWSHPVRARIRSVFTALGAQGENESDALAIAERRAERRTLAAAAAGARMPPGEAARAKAAADSARMDTVRVASARADTASAVAARADTTARAAARDTARPAAARDTARRTDSVRPAPQRPDTTRRTPSPTPAVQQPAPLVFVPPRDTTRASAPAQAWSVQVAATADTSLARHAASRLRDLGLTPRTIREDGLLKVRTPAYPSQAAARAILGRVRTVFPDAFVTGR